MTMISFKPLFRKILFVYQNITVELPLLLIFTAFLLLGSVLTNLMIYRTCYIILNYNETDCALLGRISNNVTQELERKVQPTANIISLILELPMNILPVIICIFAGPWSDKHGRKPVQLMALAGLTGTFFILAVMVSFPYISPWYFLIATIPTMFTGSLPTYFTVVLAYLNDISTDETRAVRMAVFEAVMTVGLLIGSFSSAPLLYATNYGTVFSIATALLIVATLYTMLIVPESVKLPEGKKIVFNEIVQCSYVAQMVKTVFKKRVKYNRIIIIALFFTTCIINFITNGQNVVKFQFLREKLGWTLQQYNLFCCLAHIVTIIGTLGGILILVKVLKIKETIVATIGLMFTVATSVLWGIANNDYYIYIGTLVGVLSSVASPLIRTRIAQIVPSDEMGKIFSLLIGAGGLLSVGATYLYTMIYNATINLHSGSYNFLSAFLYLFAIFLMAAVIIFELCSPSDVEEIISVDEEVISDEPQILKQCL